MRYFRALANLGATIVILHHSGKAETAKIYRGSSDIKAAVDTAYQLESIDKECNRLGRLSLKCFKGRLMPGQNFAFEFREKEGLVAIKFDAHTRTVEEVITQSCKSILGAIRKKLSGAAELTAVAKGKSKSALRPALGPPRRVPTTRSCIA